MDTFNKPEDRPAPLDKVQIAALRKADAISFHHYQGKSYIAATKRVERTVAQPFADDVRIDIPCGWRLTNYDPNDSGLGGPAIEGDKFVAFDMIHTAQYEDGIWQTVASLLKPGDVLTLHWTRNGGTTQALNDAHMVGDRLRLVVERGDRKLRFQVGEYFGPASNTSRMVRWA